MTDLARRIVRTVHSMPLDTAEDVDAQIQAVEAMLQKERERPDDTSYFIFVMLLILVPALILGISLSAMVPK